LAEELLELMGRRRRPVPADAPPQPPITAFREAEKRYRPRTNIPTDYSDVLDMRDGADAAINAGTVRRAGRAYELAARPGLFVLPDAITPNVQRRLAHCCYSAYHRPPAETNLTWLARRDGLAAPPRTATPPQNLRWATLGHHYDWTNRCYACDHAEPMPRHLATVCDGLCAAIGVAMTAEAAIVNYYRPGDTMGGHVDDAEVDKTRPLVSVSLGCSAVFLVGGATRDISPTALWLRSGDACIFTGAARSYYHGVPRILEGTCPPHLCAPAAWPDAPGEINGSDGDYAAGRPAGALDGLCEFLRGARLNLNVREVGD